MSASRPYLVQFWGIAGVGKTTLSQLLVDELTRRGERVYLDSERLAFGAAREVVDPDAIRAHCLRAVEAFAEMAANEQFSYILVDRFYETFYEWRGLPLAAVAEIEEAIARHFRGVIVHLVIDEAHIPTRIIVTREQRGEAWAAREQPVAQKILTDTRAQRVNTELAQLTRFPVVTLDTTTYDWPCLLARIVSSFS